MKKIIILLFAVFFSISLNSQRNPNAEYWISFTYQPQKGMVEKFEKAVANKTKKYNTSEETAIFAFQIIQVS